MTIYQGGYAAYARGDRPILTPEQPEPEPVPAVPEKKSKAGTFWREQRAEDAKRRKTWRRRSLPMRRRSSA